MSVTEQLEYVENSGRFSRQGDFIPDNQLANDCNCARCDATCGPYIGEDEYTGHPTGEWAAAYVFPSMPTIAFCEPCAEACTEAELFAIAQATPCPNCRPTFRCQAHVLP